MTGTSPPNAPIERSPAGIDPLAPEAYFGGYTLLDGTVQFYLRVNALIEPGMTVLNFGAGRGAGIALDRIAFRRSLRALRGKAARVVGVDVAREVLENPDLDEARVVEPGARLPFADATFDMIVCDYVFEHIADAGGVAAELGRVLKPGGWLCARTPNKWGYVAVASRLVPNRAHAAMLERIQPGRLPEDVFAVRYRLNTRGALRRAFPEEGWLLAVRGWSGDPAYFWGSRLLFRAFRLLHALLPEALATAWLVFARKRPEAA